MNNIIKIESNLPKDFLRIELHLSNVCNYKCNYCFPGSHEGTHGWPKPETFLNNLDHLIEYYRTNAGKKQIYIHILGGEPTLWKDFGPFVQHLKTKHNCLISISSNGSRTIRWWNEYGHYVDKVLLSCHPEYVDTAHIKKVGDLLHRKNVEVVALVLMDTKYWNRCLEVIEELNSSEEVWDIALSEVYHNSVMYNKEQKETLYKDGRIKKFHHRFKKLYRYIVRVINQKKTIPVSYPTIYRQDGTRERVLYNWLILNKLYNFKGWKCNLGVDTLYIERDGNMQGACSQLLYDLNFMYNIFDEDFKEKFTPNIVPTTCHKSTACACQAETNTTKEKTITFHPK